MGISARRRLASSLLLATVVLVAGAGSAAAHVSVDAGGAGRGADDAVLTFRVPNERAGARTVRVDITLPTKTPVGSVKPAAKAGWTVTTERVTYATPIVTTDGEITEGVGKVSFRAGGAAGGIAEDTFETFQLLVGPLPSDVSTLAFPTVQTYSNGAVSSWIQPAVAGSEPDHPAPVLTLDPAAGSGSGAAGTGAAGPVAAQPVEVASPTRAEVRTARLIGLLGVLVGAAGLVTAGLALGRTRRMPTTPQV